jgi:hypothetical protein
MSPGARGASLPPSYASGMSDMPLLGKNTGDNFDRTVAADPAREALVEVPTGQRWPFAPLRANVDALALGVLEIGVQKDSSRCSRTTTSRTMCSSSRTS